MVRRLCENGEFGQALEVANLLLESRDGKRQPFQNRLAVLR